MFRKLSMSILLLTGSIAHAEYVSIADRMTILNFEKQKSELVISDNATLTQQLSNLDTTISEENSKRDSSIGRKNQNISIINQIETGIQAIKNADTENFFNSKGNQLTQSEIDNLQSNILALRDLAEKTVDSSNMTALSHLIDDATITINSIKNTIDGIAVTNPQIKQGYTSWILAYLESFHTLVGSMPTITSLETYRNASSLIDDFYLSSQVQTEFEVKSNSLIRVVENYEQRKSQIVSKAAELEKSHFYVHTTLENREMISASVAEGVFALSNVVNELILYKQSLLNKASLKKQLLDNTRIILKTKIETDLLSANISNAGEIIEQIQISSNDEEFFSRYKSYFAQVASQIKNYQTKWYSHRLARRASLAAVGRAKNIQSQVDEMLVSPAMKVSLSGLMADYITQFTGEYNQSAYELTREQNHISSRNYILDLAVNQYSHMVSEECLLLANTTLDFDAASAESEQGYVQFRENCL